MVRSTICIVARNGAVELLILHCVTAQDSLRRRLSPGWASLGLLAPELHLPTMRVS